MNSEVKSVVIIVIITAIIIVLGLSLTGGGSATKSSVTPIQDILMSTTTPVIYGLKSPAAQQVQIIEFGDFACPACAMLSPNIDKLLVEKDGFVTYGFRIIPIHGDLSYNSAIAAFAAGKQGRFFEMGSKLFAKQDEWVKPGVNTSDLFLGYAKEVGVPDLDAFKSDVASSTFIKVIKQMVDRDADHARQMGIRSTPTLIIDGEHVIEGVSTYAKLADLVDSEIEKKKNGDAAATSSASGATVPVGGTTTNPAIE